MRSKIEKKINTASIIRKIPNIFLIIKYILDTSTTALIYPKCKHTIIRIPNIMETKTVKQVIKIANFRSSFILSCPPKK